MTPDQFDALQALVVLKAPITAAAARRVLVDGLTPSAAADEAGISRQTLSNTLTRLRKALELARVAAGS